MITIEVYRGDGDRQGDDIADPFIGSEACALSRGRNEMDARAQGKTQVKLIILHRPGLRLGQLIQATDISSTQWIGIITGIAHELSNGKALTTLTIDRPRM